MYRKYVIFEFRTVSASGPALSTAMSSPATLMTNFASRVYTDLALEGLIPVLMLAADGMLSRRFNKSVIFNTFNTLRLEQTRRHIVTAFQERQFF